MEYLNEINERMCIDRPGQKERIETETGT